MFQVISRYKVVTTRLKMLFRQLHTHPITVFNEKSAQRDTNTARALAVVRFGHRPLARPPQNKHTHTQTDRTDYNTLHRSVYSSIKYILYCYLAV